MSNTAYPGALDSPTNPTSSNKLPSPDHALQHSLENDAIVALETKLGTGASTPTNNTFLVGNGTGTSAWGNTVPAGTVVGTSDSQTLTNKTLTSPVINTPTFSAGAVPNTALSTTAIVLGYAQITTGVTLTTGNSDTDVTGVTVTVTVPTTSRLVRVTVFAPYAADAANSALLLFKIKESTTALNEMDKTTNSMNERFGVWISAVLSGVSAGSHTYKLTAASNGGGNTTIAAASTAPAYIMVEIL